MKQSVGDILMKKFIIMTIFVLSTLLIITACSTEIVKSEPEISLSFNVSNLTDEKFLYVGTKGLNNPTKNDFKNIEFTLDVKNSDTLDKIMKILSTYSLSPFHIEESAKEFVEKITGKDLSKIIPEIDIVLDLIEEDNENFSAIDFEDS